MIHSSTSVLNSNTSFHIAAVLLGKISHLQLYSDLSDSILVTYNFSFLVISCGFHLRNYFQWLLGKYHPRCFTSSKNVHAGLSKLFKNYVVSSLSFLSMQKNIKYLRGYQKCQVLSIVTFVYHKSFVIVRKVSEKDEII